MAMHKGWEELRTESIAAGRAEGIAAGRAEGIAGALLTVLRARGIALSEAAQFRIASETDLERLKRWLERAAVAASIEDVIDEPR